MEVSDAELVALFALWCDDIDAEPFAHACELAARARQWAYRQRYLLLVGQVLDAADRRRASWLALLASGRSATPRSILRHADRGRLPPRVRSDR